MQITMGKVLSLALAAAYTVALVIHEHGFTRPSLGLYVFLLIALALVWFPEALGNYTGYAGLHNPRIDTPTPAVLVAIVGWLFLLVVVPILLYSLWRYPVEWWR